MDYMEFVTIVSCIENDPGAAANVPVPGGFAGFSAVERFIRNAAINNDSIIAELSCL